MTESKAWKALTVYEHSLYLHFKIKYRGVTTSRNLSFTYEEAKELMSAKRFTKAIDRLIETGFIDLVEHRPLTPGKQNCTIYGLSARWRSYGAEDYVPSKRPKISRAQTGKFYGNQYVKGEEK